MEILNFVLQNLNTWSAHQPMHTLKLFIWNLLKILRRVSVIRSSSGSCLFLAKITLLEIFTAWFSYNNLAMWQHVVLCRSSVAKSAADYYYREINQWMFFNNVILTRNRQLPDDDRMIETCRSIFKKSF
jgi:hypothetical protein